MGQPFSRRDALRTGLAALTVPFDPGRLVPPPRGVRSFRLIEPSGLRRFGYPISTVVPDAANGRHFRLLQDGRVIPAQFREVEGVGGGREVALDFIASPAPLEAAEYEVHFGLEIEPGPEPKTGLTVEKRDGRFVVSQGRSMTYEFADDLSGFLRNAGSPRLAYLGEARGGLVIQQKGIEAPAIPFACDPMKTRITREGPFAISLRFEGSNPSGFRSIVDVTIPHSKSWVQTAWTVDDPRKQVAGLGFDLPLLLEGSPTLVDFGAGSTVYGQIKPPQRMELEAHGAGRDWVIRQGQGEIPPILAASTPESPRPAEGWAHLMDSRRCTALAVANFGRGGASDRISATADGAFGLIRTFTDDPREAEATGKTLTFWLHFVPMPVQVGAATSPQSILSPLVIAWDRPLR